MLETRQAHEYQGVSRNSRVPMPRFGVLLPADQIEVCAGLRKLRKAGACLVAVFSITSAGWADILTERRNPVRNHRDEIELALSGGAPAYVPFSFYDVLFPPGFDPRPLQARGMAICARRNIWTKVTPNVKVTEIREPDGSVRTVYGTPVGSLSSYNKAAALAHVMVEHPIRSRDDYRVAKFIVDDTQYVPQYDQFLAEIAGIGQSGKVIAHTCYEPLMDIQLLWIGQEQFCLELADNPDALMELHAALVRGHLRMYDVSAKSPADYILYGGNVVPEMLGPDRVRDLIRPCWNAFADRLHEQGKFLGCHLDANNRAILATVRESRLDFVEAFTPPPDCDVPVDEALEAWPGKRLWVNFPSSVHLQDDARIRETAVEIIRQAGDRKGFLMGVTEDVPAQHLDRSCTAILDGISACPL